MMLLNYEWVTISFKMLKFLAKKLPFVSPSCSTGIGSADCNDPSIQNQSLQMRFHLFIGDCDILVI